MNKQDIAAHSTLPDNDVIQEILEGKQFLFELLIRRHNPVLYRMGRSYGFRHPEIEDLLQETHIAAYINLAKFEGRSNYKTWLIKILINQCLRRMERANYKNEESKGDMADTAKPMFTESDRLDTEKLVLNKELSHLLEKSIESIPVDYRTVFVLREVEGIHIAETAKILDITEANVKVRLTRAKALLRTEIQKYYSAAAIYEFNLVYCDKIVERVFEATGKQDLA